MTPRAYYERSSLNRKAFEQVAYEYNRVGRNDGRDGGDNVLIDPSRDGN